MRKVLEMVARGEITIAEAEAQLRVLAIQEVGDLAKLDNGREMRKGIPEVLLAEGKAPEAVRDIALKCVTQMGRVIISRASGDQIETLRQALPLQECV